MPKNASQWSGSPSIKGSSESVRMILLTFCLIGLSFGWGLEATYCTPYLLSLGLSKSKISLVWIAGPLSGLLMQPAVGVLADRSTSRYGRRRPFMVGGTCIVGGCILLLAWTKEVVSYLGGDQTFQKNAAIVTAVSTLYLLDFALNVVQASCRSLIVDTLPISLQQSGSAWASRVGGLGALVSHGVGTLDLVALSPDWLGGDTQFKKVSVIATVVLFVAVGISCYCVTERVLISSPDQNVSLLGTLQTLWQRTFQLPPRMQAICWSVFWAWIGWFPFLFYSSTWVGETYYQYEHKADPSKDSPDTLGNIGRIGSLSMVVFALVTFASSVLLPLMIRSPESSQQQANRYTRRPPQSLSQPLQRVLVQLSRLPRPDLVTTWLLGNLTFAFTIVWSPFVRSVASATTIVAICGIPWTVQGWAPMAEMGIEINRLTTGSTYNGDPGKDGAILAKGGYMAVRTSMDSNGDIELTTNSIRPRSSSVLRLTHPESEDNKEDGSTGELAGVYLGVLNVYTTLPQFVSTFVSWIVFSIFEPDRSGAKKTDADHHLSWLDVKGMNAISVCFLVGACCSLIAAEATRRLKKMS